MSRVAKASVPVAHSVSEIEQYVGWALGMAATVAVLFQVHVPLPGGVINLNLADPLAILALTAVGLHAWFTRHLPAWRVSRFNLVLAAITVTLLLAFLRGWVEIGVTQWALAGRIFGWFVLMGYVSAGYLIVANVGPHGLRRFAETLVAVAVVVVVMQVLLRLLEHWGVHTGARLTPNFEGYAGNRNAFAFQILVAVSLLVGYFEVYARGSVDRHGVDAPWVAIGMLGMLWAALIWTASRTGMLVGAVLLLISLLTRAASRRPLYWSVLTAALLWSGTWLAAQKSIVLSLLSGDFGSLHYDAIPMQVLSPETSNQERWATLVRGFELWLTSPVFGAGLGVFNAKSVMWFQAAQVIHSTPVWILTEFGLVGAAIFAWAFFVIGRYAARFENNQPPKHILLLLLSAFALFGLMHEIFFQRIFWLVLGAVMAQPFSSRTSA